MIIDKNDLYDDLSRTDLIDVFKIQDTDQKIYALKNIDYKEILKEISKNSDFNIFDFLTENYYLEDEINGDKYLLFSSKKALLNHFENLIKDFEKEKNQIHKYKIVKLPFESVELNECFDKDHKDYCDCCNFCLNCTEDVYYVKKSNPNIIEEKIFSKFEKDHPNIDMKEIKKLCWDCANFEKFFDKMVIKDEDTKRMIQKFKNVWKNYPKKEFGELLRNLVLVKENDVLKAIKKEREVDQKERER